MRGICEMPEDLSAFEALISNRVGKEISGSDIELLKNDLEVSKDEETIDAFYSRSEKVRFVVLTKSCIASDQVPYEFHMGVITDLEGNAIFSQAYLIYRTEDILSGKRGFSFDNVFGSEKDYSTLVSKSTVGVMNTKQLEEYMTSLGCSKYENYKGSFSSAFLCNINPEDDLSSRLAGWNFSKRILVDFGPEGIVSEIAVGFYHPK